MAELKQFTFRYYTKGLIDRVLSWAAMPRSWESRECSLSWLDVSSGATQVVSASRVWQVTQHTSCTHSNLPTLAAGRLHEMLGGQQNETERNSIAWHGRAQNEMKRMAGNNIKRHDTRCGAGRKQPRWDFLNLINFQLPQLIHTHCTNIHIRT